MNLQAEQIPFGVLGLVLASSLLWLQYFDLKDSVKPEPRSHLLGAFVLGVLAAGLALGAYECAFALGAPVIPPPGTAGVAVFCFVLVGPIEEGAKFLVARSIVFRWEAFDERVDGIVYGAAVALGFASVENFIYFPMLDPIESLARTIASPLTHSLFAAVWGVGCSRALLMERGPGSRFAWQAGSLLLAMALHGLYDFVLLAWDATFAASGIVLVLWSGVIWRARKLAKFSAE